MDMTKIKDAYSTQKWGAINVRNIEWQFTFETWLAWWGEDIVNRGQGKGKLQMGRKGDTGPYSPDNCDKLTHEQNVSDAQKGKALSAETRDRISAALKGQQRKPLSAETRARMSAARKGMKRGPYKKPRSAEHNAKISAALKGKKRGPYKKRQASE